MYQDHKIDWKNWKSEIKKEFKIIHVTDLSEIRELNKKGGLLCSRCSKQKTGNTEKTFPKDLYTGAINLAFYKWCNFFDFDYAILSDLYGLVYSDEKVQRYDKHPSALEEKDFIELAKTIKKKMREKRYKSFIFYNTSPIMSKPYFYMMYLTGLPIYFVTKLPVNKMSLL